MILKDRLVSDLGTKVFAHFLSFSFTLSIFILFNLNVDVDGMVFRDVGSLTFLLDVSCKFLQL